MIELRHYRTSSGLDPFQKWLGRLRDRVAVAKIFLRLSRVEAGSFGDCKSVGNGVWELRMDFGPGYRIYYARDGKTVVLLLAGGDKDSQQADIRQAVEYWVDHQRRQP